MSVYQFVDNLIVVKTLKKEELISKKIFVVAMILPSILSCFSIVAIPFWSLYILTKHTFILIQNFYFF